MRNKARNSCSSVWSVASMTRPIAAREASPPSSSDGNTPRSTGPEEGRRAVARLADMAFPFLFEPDPQNRMPVFGIMLSVQKPVHGNGRLAAGDQVGSDAGRTVRHGPADMAVAGVEVEVAQTLPAEGWEIVRRHGPETRPHLGAVVV